VVAPIDLAALRAERDRRSGHHTLAHRRVEAYTAQHRAAYPGGRAAEGPLSIEGNEKAIKDGKKRWKA
jgi:hypothetical protein